MTVNNPENLMLDTPDHESPRATFSHDTIAGRPVEEAEFRREKAAELERAAKQEKAASLERAAAQAVDGTVGQAVVVGAIAPDTLAETTEAESADSQPTDSQASDSQPTDDEAVVDKDLSVKKERGGRSKAIGGVAPFVKPPGKLARAKSRRSWGSRGFVAVSPGRQKRRHRILPRTVIGISTMLMCVGIGAAFSGAAFYAYYDDRLAENEREIATFVDGFDEQFQDAAGSLDRIREESIEQVQAEMAPLGDWAADANGVVGLPAMIGDSVWTVETLSESGRRSYGSAFAVTGHNGGTALVTSFAVVRASAVGVGPGITLVNGDQRIEATLRTWDEANDLALLVTDTPMELLTMASASRQSSALGRPIFAMSGFGGQGATASPGRMLDLSTIGMQHTAAIGATFAGGPIVSGDGVVLGVASLNYAPIGVDLGEVNQSVSVDALCSVILRCAEVVGDDSIVDLSLDPDLIAEDAQDAEDPADTEDPADAEDGEN